LELIDNGIYLGKLRLCFESSFINFDLEVLGADLATAIAAALGAVLKYSSAMKMASRDSLTGLYNRRIFTEVLGREFANAKRHGQSLSLLHIDLDHFKNVNDSFGHQTGDKVLQVVAKVITEVCRLTDIPARVGGEEFAIILPQTNEEQTYVLGGRLKTALAKCSFKAAGTVFSQTVSQGIVGLEHFLVKSPEDMLYWSDKALYLAKREGRDTIRMASDLQMPQIMKDGPYAFQ
ncbi:MAG: GGDEF domain-containing protein, partial [Candidatus Adiutrix sp.]